MYSFHLHYIRSPSLSPPILLSTILYLSEFLHSLIHSTTTLRYTFCSPFLSVCPSVCLSVCHEFSLPASFPPFLIPLGTMMGALSEGMALCSAADLPMDTLLQVHRHVISYHIICPRNNWSYIPKRTFSHTTMTMILLMFDCKSVISILLCKYSFLQIFLP